MRSKTWSPQMTITGVPVHILVSVESTDWQVFRAFLGARTGEVHTTERKLQLDNALVQYSEYRAGLQVGYSGFKPFKIIAGAGCTIQRNFDFFRDNQSKRTDPAPYLPPQERGHGRPRLLYHSDAKAIEVRKWVKTQAESAWRRKTLRSTTKGKLVVEVLL